LVFLISQTENKKGGNNILLQRISSRIYSGFGSLPSLNNWGQLQQDNFFSSNLSNILSEVSMAFLEKEFQAKQKHTSPLSSE
jgi:hypothetical protein